ncbi:unnamed protein product [Allacma fusca]|uniref:DUF5641 domain-containing protein n=1 Tax=Allacma fusca TaxID=39272 RepID=A0A8J2JEA6_9HEXA|nr:unnamed protein product [Allacma fusca]
MATETQKKKRLFQYENLMRYKNQVVAHIEKTEPSFESLVKLEAIVQKIEAENARFQSLSEEIIVKLKTDDDEDKKMREEYFVDMDVATELEVDVKSKIAWIKAGLDKNRSEESIINSNSSSSSGNGSSSGFRYAPIMKEIEPPTFDGDATKFQEWRSMFENLVHENADYSPTCKLYFLKKCLVGKASNIVDHYEISRDGYAEAWSHVIYRFSKPRSVLGAFFKKLVSLETIKNENGIQNLLDTTNSVIRGLTSIGEEVNPTFSRFLAFLIRSKLDDNTKRDWENFYTNMEFYPKFKDLDKFLQSRAHVVDERTEERKISSNLIKKDKKSTFVAITNKKPACKKCNGEHAIYTCTEFLSMSPKERQLFCKSKALCVICLSYGHLSPNCKSQKFRCQCGDPHNYLLHFGSNLSAQNGPKSKEKSVDAKVIVQPVVPKSSEATASEKESLSCVVATEKNVEKTVLLPSAIVRFVCGNVVGTLRVLLDSCSQATFISDAAVKKFNLPTKRSSIVSSIRGVGASCTKTSSSVDLIVSSKKDRFRLEVQADIVPASAMKYTVNAEFSKDVLNALRNVPLADPAYLDRNISISNIDMIIGAEYFGQCILDQSLRVGTLDLRLSQFGWIVSGTVLQKGTEKFVGFTRQSIDENLRKFWEIEEAEIVSKVKDSEADRCMKHFEETYKIGEDGKFCVRLPFKLEKSKIAHNRKLALKALSRMENKLSEKLKISYSDFMKEYLEMGHMSLIPDYDPDACFLPHRAVIREGSETTPLRVVFNATAGTPSLNESLMVGPKIQRDLYDILINMRWYKYVFSADIAKMYRMIWVAIEDRKYQSIFWRDSVFEIIKQFQLNTLTYGTGPASFIATMCLEIIARMVEPYDPFLAFLIRNNFFMDDFTGGAQTIEEAIRIQRGLHLALEKFGFLLRKYSSNSKELLNNIDLKLHAASGSKTMTESLCSVPVLGLIWRPEEDDYSVKVKIEDLDSQTIVTKRIILSLISRTFDPIGLVSPVLVRGKLLLKEVWLEGKDWDDPVSPETAALFVSYIKDLTDLNFVKIPRYIFGAFECTIVGFCDASDKAYCAAVYIRAQNEKGKIFCRLISSKTRVAPVKELTIPKLELQAAKLLVDLVSRIANNLKIPLQNIVNFSDSTVVLCWLSKPPDEWKTFVSNRVRTILDVFPFCQWTYVRSNENPADDATRGLKVEEFVGKTRWFDGPEFLYHENYRSFHPIPNLDTHLALERRKVKVAFCVGVVDDFTSRSSSYLRLIRAIALICRKIRNFRARIRNLEPINESPTLSKEEVEKSEKIVVCFVQSIHFFKDIERLKINLPLKNKSALLSLDPYLDKDGVLRLLDYSVTENFEWRFIPPASPHQGGIWEAAVKSFKKHLVAVTKENALNIEEFRTLFAKIEAVLNMRPLCYKGGVEQGTEILTPSHFLIGRNIMSVPAIDSEEVNLSRRLLLIQNIFKGFWSVWSKDYLNQLQQRYKWKNRVPNVKVGQLVFVKNNQPKPFKWPLGIVRKVYPDKEGLVRVVDVEFGGQIRSRNITNLVILPEDK